MKKLITTLLALTIAAQATVVTFTGGTITRPDGSTAITDNTQPYWNVSSYTEGVFSMTYVVSDPSSANGQTVGNYYGSGDVIHGHWGNGINGLISIDITAGGSPFDLQYFQITSNTQQGGGAHTGNELIYITGYLNGQQVTPQFLLPGEDWGATSTSGYQDLILPASFDLVDMVKINGTGAFCYGMDNFVFNQVIPQELLAGNFDQNTITDTGNFTPPTIPEPSTGLLGIFALLFLLRRRR